MTPRKKYGVDRTVVAFQLDANQHEEFKKAVQHAYVDMKEILSFKKKTQMDAFNYILQQFNNAHAEITHV